MGGNLTEPKRKSAGAFQAKRIVRAAGERLAEKVDGCGMLPAHLRSDTHQSIGLGRGRRQRQHTGQRTLSGIGFPRLRDTPASASRRVADGDKPAERFCADGSAFCPFMISCARCW